MQIVLTVEDLRRLKPATRDALLDELGLARPAAAEKVSRTRAKAADTAGEPLAELVGSINDRARAALSLMVQSGGKAEWAEIAAKVPGLEPGRFLASVHRRYRTLTRDPGAVLISAKEDGEQLRLRLASGLIAKLKPLL